MASTKAICTSFKLDMWTTGQHNFTLSSGDAFKWALYTSTAAHDADTTDYTTTQEITGTNYVAGGATFANVTPTEDTGSIITNWATPTWGSAEFTAASTLLYNSTAGTDSVAVWDFGSDQVASGGDFVLQMPAYAQGSAILELA
jgi:hypothetical protein